MEIIKLILLTIILILLIYRIFLEKKSKNVEKVEETVVKEEKIDDETKEKYEKTKKAFNNLMEYDENIALKKKEEWYKGLILLKIGNYMRLELSIIKVFMVVIRTIMT